jgi:superfamily II DNA helicase RecQ
MNTFLRSHRIYHVEKQFLAVPNEERWSFCIEYDGQNQAKGQQKIDYKEVLSEKEFAVFSKLRDIRKHVAAEENIPLYAVFTNEHLAVMVKNRIATVQQMRDLNGVGESKITNYADRFTDFLQTVFSKET